MTIVAPDEILRFILVDFSRILHLQEIRRWISEKSTTITSTPLPYVDLLDTFWLKMCWKLKLCAMGGVASLWLLLELGARSEVGREDRARWLRYKLRFVDGFLAIGVPLTFLVL